MSVKTLLWNSTDNQYDSNPSYFRIGDIILTVPPSNISVQKANDFIQKSSLRSSGDILIKSGYASVSVTVEVPFFGLDEIKNKLVPLLAYYKVAPFIEIVNKFIREQIFGAFSNNASKVSPFIFPYSPLAVVLNSISVNFGEPGSAGISAFATLNLMYYNHYPISPWFEVSIAKGGQVLKGRLKRYMDKLNKRIEEVSDLYTANLKSLSPTSNLKRHWVDQEDNEFAIYGHVYKAVKVIDPSWSMAKMMNTGGPGYRGSQAQNTPAQTNQIPQADTSTGNFAKAYQSLLVFEQGYVDHPNDPGGATKYGISSRAHPHVGDVKNLTCEEAGKIAKAEYWDPCGCDNIEWPMSLVVFNRAFGSGSIKKAKALVDKYGNDWRAALEDERARLNALVQKNPKLAVFQKGWNNRINALQNMCEGKPAGNGFGNPPKECMNLAQDAPKQPEPTEAEKNRETAPKQQDSVSPPGQTTKCDADTSKYPEWTAGTEGPDCERFKQYVQQQQTIEALKKDGWTVDAGKSDNYYVYFKKPYYIPCYGGADFSSEKQALYSYNHAGKLLIQTISMSYTNKVVPIPIQSFVLPFWQHVGASSMGFNIKAVAIVDTELGYCPPLSDLQALFNAKENQMIELRSRLAAKADFTQEVQSVYIHNEALKAIGMAQFVITSVAVHTMPGNPNAYDVEIGMTENYMYAPRVRSTTAQMAMMESRVLPSMIIEALKNTPSTDIQNEEVRELQRQIKEGVTIDVWNSYKVKIPVGETDFGSGSVPADLQSKTRVIGLNDVLHMRRKIYGGTEANDFASGKPAFFYVNKFHVVYFENSTRTGSFFGTDASCGKYLNDESWMASGRESVIDGMMQAINPARGIGNLYAESTGEGTTENQCLVAATLYQTVTKGSARVLNNIVTKCNNLYSKYCNSEKVFMKIRDDIKSGNSQNPVYKKWFPDGITTGNCYPDMMLDSYENPASYIDGRYEMDPRDVSDVYSESKEVSLAMSRKIDSHFSSLGQFKDLSHGQKVSVTNFVDVKGKTDLQAADSHCDAAVMKGLDGTNQIVNKDRNYNKSFPTFKVYFIEDNMADMTPKYKDWDQFFDYEAICSIEIARFKNDVDTAVISVLNTFGELSTRMLDSGNEYMKEANQDVATDGTITDMEHHTKRLENGTLVQVDKRVGSNDPTGGTVVSPLNSIAVLPGTKIMIKMGYENNALTLPVSFVGLVSSVEPGDVLNIICQGFMSELMEPTQGWMTQEGGLWDTVLTAVGFDQGFSWSAMAGLFMPTEVTRNAIRTSINKAYTRPIAYKLLGHPSCLHFGQWLYKGQGYKGTAMYLYGSAWEVLTGQDTRSIENVDILLESNWQSRTSFWHLYPALEQFFVDKPEEDSLWDVMKQAVWRHPSHRAMVRPYGQDATLVIKQLTDLYKIRPVSVAPGQEDDYNQKKFYTQWLEEQGKDLIAKTMSKYSNGDAIQMDENRAQSFAANGFAEPRLNEMWEDMLIQARMKKSIEKRYGYRIQKNPLIENSKIYNFSIAYGNCDPYIICLPPAEVQNLTDAFNNWKMQKIKDNPALEAQMSVGDTMRPVKKYFYASSYFNIISNNIRTNADIYNTVLVKKQPGEDSDKGVECRMDDDIEDNYIRKCFVTSRNITKHWAQATDIAQDLSHLYGWSILIEKLNEMYKGEISIIGEPDIMPYDCLIIDDPYTELYGPVEVNTVIHRFTQDEGFVTFIEPHLEVRVSDMAFAVATGRMQDLQKIASNDAYYYNMDKLTSGGHDVPSANTMPWYARWYYMPGTILKDMTPGSSPTAAIEAAASGNRDAGIPNDLSLAQGGELMRMMGDGFRPFEMMGLPIGSPFYWGSDSLYNMGPYRQPVVITPLRYKNLPFVAGIRGARFNSWGDSIALKWERTKLKWENDWKNLRTGVRHWNRDPVTAGDTRSRNIYNPVD